MTPLELKTAFRVMQEELTALRDRVGALEAKQPEEKQVRKMCPHCGEQPAYHFHVVKCAKNKKNKGVNGEANGH